MKKFKDLTTEELKSEALKISVYLLDNTKEIGIIEMTNLQEEFDYLITLINLKPIKEDSIDDSEISLDRYSIT